MASPNRPFSLKMRGRETYGKEISLLYSSFLFLVGSLEIKIIKEINSNEMLRLWSGFDTGMCWRGKKRKKASRQESKSRTLEPECWS